MIVPYLEGGNVAAVSFYSENKRVDPKKKTRLYVSNSKISEGHFRGDAGGTTANQVSCSTDDAGVSSSQGAHADRNGCTKAGCTCHQLSWGGADPYRYWLPTRRPTFGSVDLSRGGGGLRPHVDLP